MIVIAVFIIVTVSVVKYISNPERQIKNFINQNNQNNKELATIAEAYLSSDTAAKTYKSVEVKQVFRGKHDTVQFYYGGAGVVPASKYYGFYYSPDDVPTAY